MDWSRRRDRAELMDDPRQPAAEVDRALRFLARINRWSLGHRFLAAAVRPGRVLDVATGGADVPAYLLDRGRARWAVGVDRSRPALDAAGRLSPAVVRVRAEASALPFPDRAFDTVCCHLLFHHLREEEILRVLVEMARVGRTVVVVDLARRRRLRWAVVVVTRLFTRSRLARHDGPVSVERAYTPKEVRRLAARAGLAGRVDVLPFDRWRLVVDGEDGRTGGRRPLSSR